MLYSALCFVCSLVVCNVKAPESQLRVVISQNLYGFLFFPVIVASEEA